MYYHVTYSILYCRLCASCCSVPSKAISTSALHRHKKCCCAKLNWQLGITAGTDLYMCVQSAWSVALSAMVLES